MQKAVDGLIEVILKGIQSDSGSLNTIQPKKWRTRYLLKYMEWMMKKRWRCDIIITITYIFVHQKSDVLLIFLIDCNQKGEVEWIG